MWYFLQMGWGGTVSKDLPSSQNLKVWEIELGPREDNERTFILMSSRSSRSRAKQLPAYSAHGTAWNAQVTELSTS